LYNPPHSSLYSEERLIWDSRYYKEGVFLDSRTIRLLQLTAEFFRDQRQQAFLVGGSLRNILLGEPCNDWDIVTAGDAPTLARGLANTLGGFYAHMHEKASRVVVPLKGNANEGDARRGGSGAERGGDACVGQGGEEL